MVYVPDLITCFKFVDDRFRGLESAEGQILPFPIDFDGRPYNTLTLPCERVIYQTVHIICLINKARMGQLWKGDTRRENDFISFSSKQKLMRQQCKEYACK